MGSGDGGGGAGGLEERVTVPAMPMTLAILCCALNFLVPGLGTIMAGFSAFCCNRYEDQGCAQRCGLCSISFGIGLLQFLLTPVLFIGWIWSCVWGVFFVRKSENQYANGYVWTTDGSREDPEIPDHVRYSVMYMQAFIPHAHPQPPPPPQPPVYHP